MKKILFLFIFLGITFSLANNINYVIPIQKEKSSQIQNSLILYQYLYDLNKLKEILELLNKNSAFKEASETVELNIKNDKSLYSVEYIQALLKILKGECKNKGYIQDIKDKFNLKYKIYLNNYPYKKLLTKNFDFFEKRIKQSLKDLNKKINNEENIKPDLNIIFSNLILALKEIKTETLTLKQKNIITPFTKNEDQKYCIPKNWAQTDGKTTLSDIVNFILNGDKKYHLLGIKNYFNEFYKNPKPFQIIH